MVQYEHSPTDEPRLPIKVEQFVSDMQGHAKRTARFLDESWSYSERHNTTLERLALWHTIMLSEGCGRAMDVGHHLLEALSPDEADPESRYEIQAAIQVIPRLVPFTPVGQAKLRAVTDMEGEDWGEHMVMEEPELVAGWHRWLWAKDPGAPRPANDHGRASLLAIAASRLSDNLRTVLGANQTSPS